MCGEHVCGEHVYGEHVCGEHVCGEHVSGDRSLAVEIRLEASNLECLSDAHGPRVIEHDTHGGWELRVWTKARIYTNFTARSVHASLALTFDAHGIELGRSTAPVLLWRAPSPTRP